MKKTKRHYKNSIEKMIDSMQTIEKLIESEQLNIRVSKESVIFFISLPLHLAMIDNALKANSRFYRFLQRIGLYVPNERYINFLYKVLAYANHMRCIRLEDFYWKPVYVMVSNTKEDDVLLHGFFNPENKGSIHFDTTENHSDVHL